MNKFGQKEMPELIAKLRKASSAIYIAVEEPVAKDISAMLTDAADTLQAADGYYMSVESALV